MVADTGLGGPVGALVPGVGWIVVAAALGVVEVVIASYYRARRRLEA
jgi:hypothetical protein